MLEFLRETMVKNKTIDAADVDRFIVSDSPEEIASIVGKIAREKFGLRDTGPKRKWWLFE